MAIRNIKEVHIRLLDTFGGLDRSERAIAVNQNCVEGVAGAAVSTGIARFVGRRPNNPPIRCTTSDQDRGERAAAGEQAAPVNRSAPDADAVGGPPGTVVQFSARPPAEDPTREVLPGESSGEPLSASPDDPPPASDEPETVHYMIWQVELGARLYKVPEGKLASLQTQAHADQFRLFDDLATAKAEAEALFEQVCERRAAKGLSRSILQPVLEDLKRWDEHDVPSYFL